MIPVRIGTTGPTQPEFSGQTVSFAPVARLAPGETLEYRVRVQAKKPGKVRIQAGVTSQSVRQPRLGGDVDDDHRGLNMPRFVVLQHDGPQGRHWDFMLETGSSLSTWALAQAPGSAARIAARALPDHRLEYLDYEGPISGGRGAVTRWDQGTFHIERQAEGFLVVLLSGKTLCGRVTLQRSREEPQDWSLLFEPPPVCDP